MNQTLSTFLKMGITVVAIAAFLFGIGYNMVQSEVNGYESSITSVELPN